MTTTYRPRYVTKWSANQNSLDTLISEDRDVAAWHKPSDLPAVPVSSNLNLSLMCAYAGDRRRAEVFLRRTLRNADRLITEQRFWDTDVAQFGHPRELGEVERDRAYAAWLLGKLLNRPDVRRAAEHLANWCLTKAPDRARFIDSLTMDFYLQGVRAALVSGDVPFAAELMRTKRHFRWHHGVQYALWSRLLREQPELSDEFDREFERFFDQVRDPDFTDPETGGQTFICREILALDTGIIREMYANNASPLTAIHPEVVIAAISR